MTLYKGAAFEEFLVDRAAMGFNTSMIQEEFEAVYGTKITETEIDVILSNSEEKIKARETELLEEMKSSSVLGRLEKIYHKVELMIESNINDPREFAMLSREARGFLEAIAKVTGQMKDTEIKVDRMLVYQQNFDALTELEKMGIIDIKEKKLLKEKMGLK